MEATTHIGTLGEGGVGREGRGEGEMGRGGEREEHHLTYLHQVRLTVCCHVEGCFVWLRHAFRSASLDTNSSVS